MQPLTKEQALAVTGFTGVTCCNFATFQADVERRFGRPVWTHEFAEDDFSDAVRESYRADFMAMIPEVANAR